MRSTPLGRLRKRAPGAPTQAALAEALGVTSGHVANIECGYVAASAALLARWARAIGRSALSVRRAYNSGRRLYFRSAA